MFKFMSAGAPTDRIFRDDRKQFRYFLANTSAPYVHCQTPGTVQTGDPGCLHVIQCMVWESNVSGHSGASLLCILVHCQSAYFVVSASSLWQCPRRPSRLVSQFATRTIAVPNWLLENARSAPSKGPGTLRAPGRRSSENPSGMLFRIPLTAANNCATVRKDNRKSPVHGLQSRGTRRPWIGYRVRVG
jgi:hypothetical protein